MASSGEHEIETHPRMGRRLLVAGCVALGLFILGLIAEAHAAPSATQMRLPAAGSPWALQR